MTGMTGFIDGRVSRKTSNALAMSFSDGPGEPFAVARQSGADGKGAKLGTLFGFKNGGTGTHTVAYSAGGQLRVQSRDAKPTLLTRADGTEVATVTRGETSTATAPDATVLLRFAADPTEPKTPDLFRVAITTAADEPVGTIEVIRRVGGWSTSRILDAAVDLDVNYWLTRTGEPLKIPIHGTRVLLTRDLSPIEREVVVGACVDMAIGLRPYITEMN
jgi:hypothetical protein